MGKDQDRRKTKIDWKTYNKKLVDRGHKAQRFTGNLARYVRENWAKEVEEKNNAGDRSKGGRKFQYPDTLFILLCVVKAYNGLTYRLLEGYANPLLEGLPVPSFGAIRERVSLLDPDAIKKIDDEIVRAKLTGKRISMVWDASGLRINGKHVWNEEKYGQKKKRKWKKVHFAADIESGIIVGFNVHEPSESEVKEERLYQFMAQIQEKIGNIAVLERFFGDGAYDVRGFFEFLKSLGIVPVIRIDKPTIEFIRRQLLMNKRKIGTPCAQWKPEDERAKRALEQVDWKGFVEKQRYGLRSGGEGIIGAFKGRFGETLFSKLDRMILKEVAMKVLLHNVVRA